MVNSLLIVLGLFLLMAFNAKANDPDEFKQYLNYANSLKNSSANALQIFDPQQSLPGYDPNPVAMQHFNKEDAALKEAAMAQRSRDVAGSTVEQANRNRSIYSFNPDVPSINRAALIEDNADAIVRGQSNAAVDCHQQKHCEEKLVEKTCHEQVRDILQQCTSIPHIAILHEPYTEAKIFTGGLSGSSNPNDWLFQLPENGVITHISVSIGHNGNEGPFLCHTLYNSTLNGQSIGSFGPVNCGHWFGVLSFDAVVTVPITAQQMNVVHIGPYVRSGWVNYANYNVSVNVTRERKTAEVSWQESCDAA